ncbi:UNVERIFIED_CONTAM: Retrovirus-related Pol polyprotein from transposon RE2 [Sesamum angustifolium]|uniref:Retrovirus-related Pol polyprotein from transposon RE2 n=1 Tax=Sesamum angustifolium TaxID=2727405 RepID=A0AAW2J980_9LAMI
MIRSMMSFTELPLSFWGYVLETTARLLNIAPSKIVAQTPYQIWHGKPASYKYLRVYGSPAYVKRLVGDKLDSRFSLCRFIGYLKETAGYYFYDPLSKRSARVPQPPERYGFLGVTVDRPKGVRPVGCKWVYKRKIGADGKLTTFKAKLVAKRYIQRLGVDLEETFSPVAMAKSIRIMLAIIAWYDYKIWQMDLKTAFLNGFVEEEIYMDEPEGFRIAEKEQKSGFVFKLNDGVVAWKSSKQDTTADSTTEAEYVAASEAAKEAVWMKNYIQELGVAPSIAKPIVIFCENNRVIAQAKEPKSHHRSKHILRRHHLHRDLVGRGNIRIDRVSSIENIADPLTKPVSQIAHAQHLGKMGFEANE